MSNFPNFSSEIIVFLIIFIFFILPDRVPLIPSGDKIINPFIDKNLFI